MFRCQYTTSALMNLTFACIEIEQKYNINQFYSIQFQLCITLFILGYETHKSRKTDFPHSFYIFCSIQFHGCTLKNSGMVGQCNTRKVT